MKLCMINLSYKITRVTINDHKFCQQLLKIFKIIELESSLGNFQRVC